MFVFFFFNDTATTEIYTLSLHDALPIWAGRPPVVHRAGTAPGGRGLRRTSAATACPAGTRPLPGRSRSACAAASRPCRSEEHTSELQSRQYLVCRLLLEKKKKQEFIQAS